MPPFGLAAHSAEIRTISADLSDVSSQDGDDFGARDGSARVGRRYRGEADGGLVFAEVAKDGNRALGSLHAKEAVRTWPTGGRRGWTWSTSAERYRGIGRRPARRLRTRLRRPGADSAVPGTPRADRAETAKRVPAPGGRTVDRDVAQHRSSAHRLRPWPGTPRPRVARRRSEPIGRWRRRRVGGRIEERADPDQFVVLHLPAAVEQPADAGGVDAEARPRAAFGSCPRSAAATVFPHRRSTRLSSQCPPVRILGTQALQNRNACATAALAARLAPRYVVGPVRPWVPRRR